MYVVNKRLGSVHFDSILISSSFLFFDFEKRKFTGIQLARNQYYAVAMWENVYEGDNMIIFLQMDSNPLSRHNRES